jgi:hypothetical protein
MSDIETGSLELEQQELDLSELDDQYTDDRKDPEQEQVNLGMAPPPAAPTDNAALAPQGM